MIYLQAKMWRTLPSQILHIQNWQDAFSIDQAVWNFGTELEAALQAAEEKKKGRRAKATARDQTLSLWITDAVPGAARFRDPAKEMG